MGNKSDGAPRFAIDLIRSACGDGDLESISALSAEIAQLCGNVHVALRDVSKRGAHPVSKGAIAKSEAANFAYRMLKACERHQVVPPKELVDLFQVLLEQDRPPGNRTRKYVQREEAIIFLASRPGASAREIAKHVGVAPSTVTRWCRDGVLHLKSVRNTV